VSLRHPNKFQWVSRLGFVTVSTSTEVAERRSTKLCTMSGRLLCWYTIYIYIHLRGLLPPSGILPCAKFTLPPSLAFSYIGRVTARHSSSGRQPNCSVEQTALPIFGRAAITLGIGPHSSLIFVCLLFIICVMDHYCLIQKINETRSTGTAHTSAKAHLTSVAIRIRIWIRIQIRIRDRSPPKFNRLFNGPLPTFPEHFMQIRWEVFAQSC